MQGKLSYTACPGGETVTIDSMCSKYSGEEPRKETFDVTRSVPSMSVRSFQFSAIAPHPFRVEISSSNSPHFGTLSQPPKVEININGHIIPRRITRLSISIPPDRRILTSLPRPATPGQARPGSVMIVWFLLQFVVELALRLRPRGASGFSCLRSPRSSCSRHICIDLNT